MRRLFVSMLTVWYSWTFEGSAWAGQVPAFNRVLAAFLAKIDF